MRSCSILAAVAIAVAPAGCVSGSTDLTSLVGAKLNITGMQLEDGTELVHVVIDYDGVSPQVDHDCAVLDLTAKLNGARFDEVKPGEWREISLAGGNDYCTLPEMTIHRSALPGGPNATIEIKDSSTTFKVVIPDLLESRTIELPATTIHSRDMLRFATTIDASDTLARGRVRAEVADQQCGRSFLFDAAPDPTPGGYSVTVPDVIDRQTNQHETFVCNGKLEPGVAVPADIVLTVGVTPAVFACEGVDACSVSWSNNQVMRISFVP